MSNVGRESFRGSLAVALAAALWGTWKLWLVGPTLDSGAQGGLVLTTAGILSTAVALRSRRSWPGLPRHAWLFLLGFGVAEAINSGLYFLALSAGDTATAAVTHYLAPVMIAVASPIVREPMGKRAMPAAIVAFAAMLGLVGFGSASAGTRLAAFAGAGSAVFYAAGVFLSKRVTTVFRPWEIVGFHDLIAGPLIALTSHTPLTRAAPRELLLALSGAVVAGAVAAAIYMYGLTRISPARASILAYLEPVSATVIGCLFLHEHLTGLQVLAMAIIVLSGVVVALEPPPALANERAPAGAWPAEARSEERS